jgi:hypothetical protein
LGKLVQFEARQKDRSTDASTRPEKAEILIFTGIRYERQATPDSEVPSKPTPTRGVKRKRG